MYGSPKPFMLKNCVCFSKNLFNLQFRLHYLTMIDLFCGFVSARRFCGLVVPWECRFACHAHAVVFQFLGGGERPMAMEKSDTVLPTYENPGRMDMADTAEAGTEETLRGLNRKDVEGYVVADMSAELVRRKVAWCSQEGSGVGAANDIVSGAASGN